MIRASRTLLASATSLALASLALAQTHPEAPALSSNLGATYTLYLNFGGFDYSNVANPGGTGRWGGSGYPGNVPSYDIDGDGTTFNQAEQDNIRDVWARFSNAFQGFNINVTTVDPAAGSAVDDAGRQAYYDRTQYVQQTIIGGSYNWFGTAGGVSYLGTTQYGNNFSGSHTNWVFPENGTGTEPHNVAAAGIHEDGHALRLGHQTDESNGDGYSDGDYDGTNYRADGTYGPIMGVSYYTQRGTWRQGSAGVNDNDVFELQQNLDMGPLADDGIGHSFADATALAVNADGTVNVNSADSKGFIMPTEASGYSASEYTKDYFKFTSAGGLVTLTANDGNSLLQAGVADPGATMRSVMNIYTNSGALVGTAVESGDTLRHTFSGILASGNYYAEILSYGAYVSSQEPGSRYFNMGGYFLTGSGFQAVPEPASMIALAAGMAAMLRRRKKAA